MDVQFNLRIARARYCEMLNFDREALVYEIEGEEFDIFPLREEITVAQLQQLEQELQSIEHCILIQAQMGKSINPELSVEVTNAQLADWASQVYEGLIHVRFHLQ
jgi:hypothetical protein